MSACRKLISDDDQVTKKFKVDLISRSKTTTTTKKDPENGVAIKGKCCDSTTLRHRREKKGMWHLSRKIALFLM
jgi:hypothetical protein